MVVAALIRHPESELIVQSCSRAVGKLSKLPKNAVAIHHAGDSQVLIDSLVAHRSNELAAYQLCQTLSIIALGDLDTSTKLGSLGGCQLVVDTLMLHRGSSKLVNQGFMAVKSLAYLNPGNQQLLRDCGVCPLLLDLFLDHQLDNSVCQSACWAINNLSANNATNATLLSSLGACELVVRTLSRFSSDINLCQYACSSLYHLTLDSVESCIKCSFSKGADALMAALTAHRDNPFLVEHALLTAKHMCCNSIGRHKLGSAGICKEVVGCFPRFDRNKKLILLLLQVIFSLCLENIENQIRFIENGALRMIVLTLHSMIDVENDRPSSQEIEKIKRNSSGELSTYYIGNVNLSAAFSTKTSVTHDACLTISALEEGLTEITKRREADQAHSIFGALKRITNNFDSSRVVMELAKKHILIEEEVPKIDMTSESPPTPLQPDVETYQSMASS